MEEALAAGFTHEQIEAYQNKPTKDAARSTMMALMFPGSANGAPANKESFVAAFGKFDSNSNGELDEKELAAVFSDLAKTLLNHAVDMDDDVRDYAKDDVVDFAEGAASVAFSKLDADKSGGISIDELWPMIASGELAVAIASSAGDMDASQAADAAKLVRKNSEIKASLSEGGSGGNGVDFCAAAFKRFDEDGDAKLERAELVQLFMAEAANYLSKVAASKGEATPTEEQVRCARASHVPTLYYSFFGRAVVLTPRTLPLMQGVFVCERRCEQGSPQELRGRRWRAQPRCVHGLCGLGRVCPALRRAPGAHRARE